MPDNITHRAKLFDSQMAGGDAKEDPNANITARAKLFDQQIAGAKKMELELYKDNVDIYIDKSREEIFSYLKNGGSVSNLILKVDSQIFDDSASPGTMYISCNDYFHYILDTGGVVSNWYMVSATYINPTSDTLMNIYFNVTEDGLDPDVDPAVSFDVYSLTKTP